MTENITVPEGREKRILEENCMRPDEFGVVRAQADYIVVRCYVSGCDIIIHKGHTRWD